ncbi:MAG TPA: RagB/SusD family nutrient uptake outer membrane protein [Gemmatimonadaceae bacterium]|nr:RagB/SusD family nutrient uptake outer membrane protein [Gemmatimonadaceae bacterium]
MQSTTNRMLRIASHGLVAGALLASAACRDILKVQDPQNFAASTLDNPILWPAIANGAEGDLMLPLDDFAIFSGMLSDELWDSSTWIDWRDISTGAIRPNRPQGTFGDNVQNALLRARYSSQAAADRFTTGMGDSATTSPLMVQVKTVDAWADLELGMGFCESPPTQGAAAVSDTVMFKNALAKLTAVLALVQNAHYAKPADRAAQINWITAGIARANLMLGNYDAALAAAQQVPAGYEKDAIFSSNSTAQNNNLFVQGNAGSNRSYTIRGLWYNQVDTIGGGLKDWYSGKLDPRVPLSHDNNNSKGYNLGAGGVVKFFSNGKANVASAPLAMAKYAEMVLIQAEVYWRKGQFQTAIDKMNINRAAAALPNLELPTTGDISTWVRDALLSERFAQLYTEGFRMQDLYRFNLVTAKLGPGRLIKLPLSVTEANNNPNIRIGGGKCPGIS